MNLVLSDWIIMFVSMLVQAGIQSYIYELFFDLRFSVRSRIIFSLIFASYTTAGKLLLPISLSFIYPFLVLILTTLILKYFNKSKSFLKCLISTIFLMVISIPIEAVGGLIVFNYLKLPTNTDNVVATIPMLIFMNLFHMLVVCICYIIKKKKHIFVRVENKAISVNIIFAFLLVAPNIMFYTTNKYNYPIWLLIYNIISSIVLVILTVYNTYKSVKLGITERDLQNSEMHNKTLNELIDSIRIFKHDYNNVVHAIGGYIATNDMEGLKNYYDGLAKDSAKVNQLENISPTIINEPSIYGILASKYQTAESKHLEFNFESMINYQDINMPVYDFCKVLGILLDNAIEASENTAQKQINVSVRRNNKMGIYLISIENSYEDKDIDTEKIYEKNFSTKNRKSGLGLWEVKNIIDKYENVNLITSKDNQFFKQELCIKIKNENK